MNEKENWYEILSFWERRSKISYLLDLWCNLNDISWSVFQVTDVSQRNSSSGTSGSASSPSSGVSSQLTGCHVNNSSSQAALAQIVGQQLLMQSPLSNLSPQDIQALASSLQQQQQSIQQQIQQFAIFQQANTAATGQIPQFFIQNQVGFHIWNINIFIQSWALIQLS